MNKGRVEMKGKAGLLLACAVAASPAMAAHTTFMCGSQTCTESTNLTITGIDNLRVGGKVYDVTFDTATEVSPFNFNASRTESGMSSAVAAANAINKFFGSEQMGSVPQDNGPFGTVTVAQKMGSDGAMWAVAATPFGGAYQAQRQAVFEGDSFSGLWVAEAEGSSCQSEICTTWTQVGGRGMASAPEIDATSMAAPLTLLAGLFAVLRRRAKS